jgi:hypothetical protein
MAKKSSSVAKRRRGAVPLGPRKTYRVHVHMSAHETAANLGTDGLDHCCMPQPPRNMEGHRQLHAFASGAAIAELRRKGRKVEILADTAVEGKKAQKNVSTVDRFKGGRSGPPGVGDLL